MYALGGEINDYLVWLGFLVAIIVIINTLLGKAIFGSITGDATYFQDHSWPMAVMFIISGVMSWYLGKYINKPDGKVYIDTETGEKVMFNKKHSLFFIKMEYWGPILGVIAIVTLITR